MTSRLRSLAVPLAVVALLAGFYAVSYRGILFEPGHVYQNWDQSIPPYPSQIVAYGNISRDTWSSIFELGSSGVFTGIGRAFDLLMREGLSGLDGAVLARWFFLAYVLIGGLGYWRLCRRLGLSVWPTLTACLLSQFNPRTYTLAISGHGFESGFSLMLVPWIVGFAESARRARGPAFAAWSLAAGLGCGLAFSGSPIGLALTAAFLAVWAVATVAASRSFRPLAVLALAGAVVLPVQAHWVLPAAVTGSEGAKYNLRLEDARAHYQHVYRDFSAPPRQAMIGHTRNLGMGTEQAYPVEGTFGPWWEASAYALLGLALLGLLARPDSPGLKWFAGLCLLTGFWFLSGYQTMPGRVLYEGLVGRVQMVFFLMARPMRWLPLYQAGLALLAGLGLQAVASRRFWRAHRWPDGAAVAVGLAVLSVYLAPWWTGELTRPKNETTQTLSLQKQLLPPEEETLVAAVAADPGLYRITVLPTILGPTGDVPSPPPGSLTRNFGLLGKDSLVGPPFTGQPFGRFLLSLAHRPEPATDAFGKLLGLGAVKRVFFDTASPYLSYGDFGWMPQTKRGPETLFDPGDVLERFLAAQGDLVPDTQWTFGQYLGLKNTDWLPRMRTAHAASLAAGGMGLLAALAELPKNPFMDRAFFFGTDMDGPGIERLGQARSGLFLFGENWPELLLPWLKAGCWHPAWAGPKEPPEGWAVIGDRWHHSLWFSSSPLDGAALWSRKKAKLEVALPGSGPHRVLVRTLALPGQWGAGVSFKGRVLAEAPVPCPLERGWRWLDLGLLDLDGSPLVIQAPGPGAVMAGILAVPELEFQDARAALEGSFPTSSGTAVLALASALAGPGSAPYQAKPSVPLLSAYPGLAFTQEGVRLDGLDGAGGGTLAAEGDQVATATFTLALPRPVSAFTLEASPRLFGDPRGVAFVRAEWSSDGAAWQPLFDLAGKTDGKWEDVYVRQEKIRVEALTNEIRVRFSLRQAQLSSLDAPPNQPMRLLLEEASPLPGAAFMGQGVLLPARFHLNVFRPGRYLAKARLLTPDGPQWFDMGMRQTDEQGGLDLSGGPSGTACDLFVLESLEGPSQLAGKPAQSSGRAVAAPGEAPTIGEDSQPQALELKATRVNQARYQVTGPFPPGGLLLFSENYHPLWSASGEPPLKAYGFMNAYPLPQDPSASIELLFTPQRLRDVGDRIALAGWAASLVACLGLGIMAAFQSRRKKGRAGKP